MNFEEINDESLIRIYKENGEQSKKALETIVKRYQPLVNSKAKKFYVTGEEHTDIIQEGMVALVSAIDNYNGKDNKASFKTFANLCVERRLISFIKVSNSQRQMPLNNAISYNSKKEGPNRDDRSELIDSINLGYNPYEEVENKEFYEKITNKLYSKLSNHEKNVLVEYMKGNSYANIAKTLQCDPKSVDTALTRIRKKSSAILNETKNN